MTFWKKIFAAKKESTPPPAEDRISEAPATPEPKAQKAEPLFHAADAFFAPIMTEKSNALIAKDTYAFRVAAGANKPMITRAVSQRYGVSVVGARMLNMPGKERRRGRIIGWKPGFKKAIVTLKKGEKIEMQ